MGMRASRRWILLVLLFFTPTIGAAQSPNVTVTVTGSGTSVDEARTDAVRQALQLTMKQLVVVDRAVNGDHLLRDRVMSTMNGYVDHFVQKGLRKVSGSYLVDAEVTVSASRIENFIGISAGPGGSVDGNSLLAEQNRRRAQAQAEQLQRKARGEIFDRIFRGFPSQALNASVLGFKLSDSDDNIVEIRIGVSFKENFRRALEGTISALATTRCEDVPTAKVVGYHVSVEIWAPGISTGCENGGAALLGAHDVACLGYADVVKCFQLAPGDYCTACRLDLFSNSSSMGIAFAPKGIVAFGRFVDAMGQSATAGGCLAGMLTDPAGKTAPTMNAFIEPFIGSDRRRHVAVVFDFKDIAGTLRVPSSAINLGQAKYFMPLLGMTLDILRDWSVANSKRWVTNLVPSVESSAQGGCAGLDEVVTNRILEAPRTAGSALRTRDGSQSSRREGDRSTSSNEPSYWLTERGSILLLKDSSSRGVEISYMTVPAEVGFIQRGAVIFSGQKEAGRFVGSGVAYIRPGCSLSYPMNISVEDNGDTLVTHGDPPTSVSQQCTALQTGPRSFRWTRTANPNARN